MKRILKIKMVCWCYEYSWFSLRHYPNGKFGIPILDTCRLTRSRFHKKSFRKWLQSLIKRRHPIEARAYYGMSDEFSGGPAFCKISSAFLKNDVFWLVCFCRLFHFHYFFNGGRIEMRGTTKWRWLIVRLFVLLVSCNVILDYFEIIILSCFNLKTFTFQSLQQQ